MSVLIRIPTPLRKHFGEQSQLQRESSSVGELLRSLQTESPAASPMLFGPTGEINKGLNVYVNEEDVRFLQKLDTPLKAGDEVLLIAAAAGGFS